MDLTSPSINPGEEEGESLRPFLDPEAPAGPFLSPRDKSWPGAPQLSYQPFLELPRLFLALIFPAKPQERGTGVSQQSPGATGEVTLGREGAELIPLSRESAGT